MSIYCTMSYEKRLAIEIVMPEVTERDVAQGLYNKQLFIMGKEIVDVDSNVVAKIKRIEFTDTDPVCHNYVYDPEENKEILT